VTAVQRFARARTVVRVPRARAVAARGEADGVVHLVDRPPAGRLVQGDRMAVHVLDAGRDEVGQEVVQPAPSKRGPHAGPPCQGREGASFDRRPRTYMLSTASVAAAGAGSTAGNGQR